ncbi:MAG: PH domain-containing protein, partial [Verrucomicrobiota bacterium]
MAEQTLWTGHSSQLKNLGAFLLGLLVIPLPWTFWQWLQVRNRVYQLTTERLLITSGVLNKTTETLEL